ncbi:MAG: RelA/SpoT family protein [Bacteroidales bacterium]|jgi:GTP pyrophosphokinase|nr:RelA/SpoT family protein [Bacteroidales bacterium]
MTLNDGYDIEAAYDDLVRSFGERFSESELRRIREAFEYANEAHKEATRKSGEPYIFHPIAVAKIVANEIKMGVTCIIAAFLHDVVEDTPTPLSEIERLFGKKVAKVVNGVTKFPKDTIDMNAEKSVQVANFRKMLKAMSEDVRVIFVKLADRLHNMRTLGEMHPRKQMKIAAETLNIFAPIAHRLGLFTIKSELEDLGLRYAYPAEYKEIEHKIAELKTDSEFLFHEFIPPLQEQIEREGYKVNIIHRIKTIYSIWKKMQNKKIPFEEIFDLLAIRIVFEPNNLKEPLTLQAKHYNHLTEKRQCFDILSLVTDIYKPHPSRVRDWISVPKETGYEALHDTVMGPHGKWVEVQIRTKRMDDIAEHGFPAHWKYKLTLEQTNAFDRWLGSLRELMKDPDNDLIKQIQDILYVSEIEVYTPKGKMLKLPKGSTVIDFAYEIHSDLGNRCVGAKINHKTVPVNQVLEKGDQIEILTIEKMQVNEKWLSFIATAKARASIRQALNTSLQQHERLGKEKLEKKLNELDPKQYRDSEKRKEIIRKLTDYYNVPNVNMLYAHIGDEDIDLNEVEQTGKDMLGKKLGELNIQPSKDTLKKLLNCRDYAIFNLKAPDQLYFLIGLGDIDLANLQQILRQTRRESKFVKDLLPIIGINTKTADQSPDKKIDKTKTFVLKEGGESYSLAPCCQPIPGDETLGYIQRRNDKDHIVIHKRSCAAANRLLTEQGDSSVAVEWKPFKKRSFLARLKLNGIDRVGIVNDVTNIISKQNNINMRSVTFDTHDGIYEGDLFLYVHNKGDLDMLIDLLRQIDGIEGVERDEKLN